MRLKKGVKVEVADNPKVPVAWHPAEIISGNGHTYCVRYIYFSGSAREATFGRVPKKAIRPCPPPVQNVKWVPGDVVQVFHDDIWKTASVLKVFQNGFYLVRVLGYFQECRVHSLHTRARQAWKDGDWIVMRKSTAIRGNIKNIKPSPPCTYEKPNSQLPKPSEKSKQRADDDTFAIHCARLEEHPLVSSRRLKRPSPCSLSTIESCTGNFQKIRAVDGGKIQRAIQAPLKKRVEANAFPHGNLGKKCVFFSFDNRSNHYLELATAKSNGIVGRFPVRSSEHNDLGCDDTCSVGSCSVTGKSHDGFTKCSLSTRSHDIYSFCSELESCYNQVSEEENCGLPPQEEVATSVHGIELHAYYSALDALHASGSLSWEHEALLTDFRISLHISNDEHMMGLRNLISARYCGHTK